MPKILRRTVKKDSAALLVALQLISLTVLSMVSFIGGPQQRPAKAPAETQVSAPVADTQPVAGGVDAGSQAGQVFTANDLTTDEKAALRNTAHFGKKLQEPLNTQVFNVVIARADAAAQAKSSQAPDLPNEGPTLTTDMSDYPPYSYVYFHGTGFQPGETVDMLVAETDPIQQSFEPWTVVADDTGSFDTSWYIFSGDFNGATFLATATGQSSQLTASATFTDAQTLQTYVVPSYAAQSATQTFTIVGQNTGDKAVRYISVDVPSGFSVVSVAGRAFSADTWGTPTTTSTNVTVATTTNTGPGLVKNDWFRIDITATTSSTAHTAKLDANDFKTTVFSQNNGTQDQGTDLVGVWVENSPTTNPKLYTAFFLKQNTTTLTAGPTPIPANATTIAVASTSGIAVNDELLIDDEQMFVTAVNNATSLTVQRARNGTTAATHANGSMVDITTMLSANINNTVTTITVGSGANIINGDTLLVDAEQMQVTAGGGTTSLTVTRGANGSTAASHTSPTEVQAVTTPATNVGTPTTYKMRITKVDSGGTKVSSVQIEVPINFTNLSVSSNTSSLGPFSESLLGNFIQLGAAGKDLTTGQWATVTFTATAPTNPGNVTWNTAAWQDQTPTNDLTHAFAISGAQPTSNPACNAVQVTANPSSTAVPYGTASVTFTAAASGSPAPTVQWEVSTNGGGSFTPIGGATSTTLTINNPHVATPALQYHAVFSNTCNGPQTATTSAATLTVTKATLTASIVNNPTKTYDGTTSATLTSSNFSLSGLVGTDSFTVTQTVGTYNSKDVATASTVTATLASNQFTPGPNTFATDYNFPTSASGAGHITKANATFTVTPYHVTYDGNSHTATVGTITGVNGETGATVGSVDLSGTTHVLATQSPYTDTWNFTGTANYNNSTGQVTDIIDAKHITGNFTAANKTYDATTAATVTGRTLNGVATNDVGHISLTGGTATFDTKNVGNNKTVTLTGATLSGDAAGNYVLDSVATTTANISAASLDIFATTQTKTYDGTTSSSATPTYSPSPLFGTDTVTGLTQAFASKNALGTNGSTLQVTAYTVNDGNSGNNYAVTTHTATGTINKASLDIFAAADTKTYDGGTTSSATPTYSPSPLYGTDTVTGLTQAFASKNVLGANGSTLNVTAYTVNDGNSGGNYQVSTHTATGTINKAPLTISATNETKTYDGTTSSSATPTYSPSPLFGTDTITGLTQAFASKNVLGANASTLQVTAYTINDTNSGNNYQVTLNTATGTINAASLNIFATTDSRTYNGTTSSSAAPTYSPSPLYGTDTLTGLTQAFQSKNVMGTNGSTLVVNAGYTLTDGNSGNNYVVTLHTATGTITAAALDISATSQTKTYDGTTSSSAIPTYSPTPLYGSDTLTGLTQSFQSKNAMGTNGSTLVVNAGYILTDGNGGGNYSVTLHTATGTITKAGLDIYATTDTRTYDGTTHSSATPTYSPSPLYGTDTLTGLTQQFESKNVLGANGSTLDVATYTVNDGNSGNNYQVSLHTATGTITKAALSISAVSDTKTYDGTTSSSATPTTSGLQTGDSVTGLTQAFVSKNVLGTDASTLQVNAGYTVNDGNSGNNYTVTLHTATGTITARDLTVTAHGVNKQYDATTAATVTLTTDKLSGDTVTAAYTAASFADKNVGTAKTVSVTGITISGADAGNYNLLNTTASTTADITARDLTVTAHGVNKQYDGTTAATVTLTTDKLSGDTVTAAYSAASFADKNVGTAKAVSVSGITISGADAGNYNLLNTTASTTADITARDLTVTAHGVNKEYDGTTTATVTLTTDKLSGDTVTAAYTAASFADKNVGTAKAVSVSGITISGADASNYNLLNTTASTTADITARDLTVTAHGVNKQYDSTTTATVTLTTDKLSGDVVTAAYSAASFADKNVGTAKTVSVIGITISGADAGNYNLLNSTASTTADITARDLTVTAHGVNKQYDSTTTATVTLTTDKLSGDVVTAAYSAASFADKNVGTAKTVSVTGITISGADAGNYNLLNSTASTTADITARDLTVMAHGVNKQYDGTVTATVTLTTDKLSGDTVTAAYTAASFADKNVGTGKTVSVSGITISGADAGNYNLLNTTASTTADITARDLTVTAHGVNKTYDGTTDATVTLTDDRVSGDVFTDSYTSANFANKNVGTGKNVSVSGISISGTDAGNYNLLNATASTTADITARDLTVTAHGVNKQYDATTGATVTLTTDKLSGDTVTAAYSAASFADKNVGTAKTVSVTGITISGADAGNYNLLNTTASTTADITARDLTVTAHGVNKQYDGTVTATVTLTTDKLSGDTVTAAYTAASFADKNVGTAKAVSVSGISISGADAGNYNLLNTTASTTADITARDLTVTAHGVNKEYDSTTTATVTLTTDKLSGDVVTAAYSAASFADKNVGTAKAVSVSGITISGADAGNYNLLNTTASTTADITARDLTVTAHGMNKQYDSTTAATVTLTTDKLSGDIVTAAYTAASFADKNVGTAKAVSVSGISISGADAGNYNLLNTTASTTADITARDLTVTAHGVNKEYDGTTTATVTLMTDKLSGDTVTAAYTTASFADKNVGTAKAVSVSGISISGADAGNYNLLNTTASTTADITGRTLTVTAHGVNKTYDGTTDATVTLTDDRVSGDVFTDSYATASFADKNVGTGKNVSVSGISISGTDAGNYILGNTTASTTADITGRALTVSAHGVNKTYDGTTDATVTLTDNRVSGDVFTDSYATASFADKNVGTGKNVSVSGISISGTDAGNYILGNTTASTIADITARTLNIYATTDSKTYDGTAASSAVATYDGLQTGDSLTDIVQVFDSRNAGSRTLSIASYNLSDGNAGANYSVVPHTASGTISVRMLNIYATTDSKTYDGTTSSSGTPTTSGVQTGDSVTGLAQAFQSKNALGTNGSTLVVTAYTVNDGNSGANYDVSTHTASGTISKAALSISAVTDTKTYDGTSASSATPTTSGLQTGDSVTGLVQAFASKNALGINGSTLQVTAYTVNDGNSGGNYDVSTHTANGTINKAGLDISATSDTKTYDGTTSSSATPSTSGLQTGDSVTGLAQAFESKNALGPNGSTLDVMTYTVNDGNNGGNYTVSLHTATGTITKASLDVYATTDSKTYDGTTSSSAIPTTSGLQTGDTVTGLAQAFVSKNVLGTNGSTLQVIAYTVNDSNGGNNYMVTLHTASGTITKAGLDIYATSDSRTYDGTTSSAAVPVYNGIISPDTVTGLSQAFGSKNVMGTNGSTLHVTAYTVNDDNSGGNYQVTLHTASGTITTASLDIYASSDSRTYNGTTSSAAVPTYSGIISPDSVTGLSQAFVSKNVLGTNGSTLQVTAYTVNDDNNGANYSATLHTASGTITTASLAIYATTDSRTYDGTTNSSAIPTTSGLQTGDSVSGLTQAFASKNVLGTNASTLAVNAGYTLNDGNAGANYVVTLHTATGTITAASLNIYATTDSRTYNGTTSSAAMPTYIPNPLYGTDTLTGLSQAFASKNVMGANGSTLVVSAGYTVNDGNSGGNYSVTLHTATGTITTASLDIYATSDTKTYDGTTSSSATPTVGAGELKNSDTVTGLAQAFQSKNVMGTSGSTLVVTAYTVNDGNSGGNYSVTPHTASGTINKANAMVVITAYTCPSTTYNGLPHTATITSITGVNGETGATVGTADVSNTTHTNAGTYSSDYWTFAGTANYNDITVHQTITDCIAKANATFTVTPYNVAYDANPHTATVSAITGVNGETGATVGTVDVSNTTHTNPGTYSSDYWFFTGTANYNNIGNTTITDLITLGGTTLTVNSASGIYGGTVTLTAHLTSGATDLSGKTISFTLNGNAVGSAVTNSSGVATKTGASLIGILPGTYATGVGASFAGDTNYSASSATNSLTVGYGTCTGSNPGHVILPPINADGTSVFKRGSTVPVKFTVCDANGNPISDPNAVFATGYGSVTMINTVRGTISGVNETTYNDIPDSAFRWSNGIWIFNMATSNLVAGNTYQFRIALKDGSFITFQFGAK